MSTAALRRLRIIAVGLVLLQLLTNHPSGGSALAHALLLVGGGIVILAGCIAVTRVLAGRRTTGGIASAGFGELLLGALFVLALVSFPGVLNPSLSWSLLAIPVLEGVLRYRLVGAVVTWAGIGTIYAAAVLAGATGGTTDLRTVLSRLGVVLLVAIPAGFLSDQLFSDIAAQRRANQAATRRSELLETVAVASQRVSKLDAEIFTTLTTAAVELGFDVADVCECDDRGHWRVLATSGSAVESLPTDGRFKRIAEHVCEGNATVRILRAEGTTEQRAALDAASLEAMVGIPVGAARVLRAGIDSGGTLGEQQVECLELLAGQAGIALRNGRLVGELRHMQGRLTDLAFRDELTGLANRPRFLAELRDETPTRGATREPAVLFCDLDRFKAVNDTLGHDVGDALLVAVAGRLRACVREEDLVARLGGDEFTVLVRSAETPAEVRTIADRLCDALGRPFSVAGHEVRVSTSVGIARLGDPPPAPTESLRRADVAMYAAKSAGRARWLEYIPALDAAARERLELEAGLREALAKGALDLVFQPIIAIADSSVAGVEALVRWRHPQRGEIPPSTFLPAAETLGLGAQLGQWVLERACTQARAWQVAHRRQLPTVAVNMSLSQLRHPAFFANLDRLLADSEIDPHGLLVEVTEHILAVGDECMPLLAGLRDRGLRLALDNFGEGPTSLRRLRQLELDVLKIDQRFVHASVDDPADRAVIHSTVRLAHELGISVVAQGVETAAQLALLRDIGCDLAQGFYLSRPVRDRSVPDLLGSRPAIPDTADPLADLGSASE